MPSWVTVKSWLFSDVQLSSTASPAASSTGVEAAKVALVQPQASQISQASQLSQQSSLQQVSQQLSQPLLQPLLQQSQAQGPQGPV